MTLILEADDSGALRLPPSVLPHPSPHRRYQVAASSGQVIVNELPTDAKPWMELAGCLAGDADELHRIKDAIDEEFERINPDDWR